MAVLGDAMTMSNLRRLNSRWSLPLQKPGIEDGRGVEFDAFQQVKGVIQSGSRHQNAVKRIKHRVPVFFEAGLRRPENVDYRLSKLRAVDLQMAREDRDRAVLFHGRRQLGVRVDGRAHVVKFFVQAAVRRPTDARLTSSFQDMPLLIHQQQIVGGHAQPGMFRVARWGQIDGVC
jgi:hypothetical protein